jgi:hypothetical protein
MGYWFVNTAGVGAMVVLTVGLSVFIAYVYMLRWIHAAPREPLPAEAVANDEENPAASTGGRKA